MVSERLVTLRAGLIAGRTKCCDTDLDHQQREEAFNVLFEPMFLRSPSMISESESIGSVIEQRSSVIIENGEVMHSQPSLMPLMNQVN